MRRALVPGAIAAAAAAAPSAAGARPFLDRFNDIATIAFAVPTHGPAQGDQNPYGVAVVHRSLGRLVRGDVLVSNFNNAQNQQGTGSSIVEISPSDKTEVFAVVPRPTATPAVGRGHVVRTLAGGDINGPWDVTAVERGATATLFVTNVLNGTVAADGKNVDRGTVVRITLRLEGDHAPLVTSTRVIADGFIEHTDPNALVVGPTGVGLGRNGVLYVADSNGNRIAAVPDALTRNSAFGHGGNTVSEGSAPMDPLGLTAAPNGDILSVNGADGNIVETTPGGTQVAVKTLVANGAGDLFGLALAPEHQGVYFVNDAGSGPATNSLQILQR